MPIEKQELKRLTSLIKKRISNTSQVKKKEFDKIGQRLVKQAERFIKD